MECKLKWCNNMQYAPKIISFLSLSLIYFFALDLTQWWKRYAVLRHPSYFGFYYWAVGTQLVLCNPISTVLYGLAAWTFFRFRISYEERTLKHLFPDGLYESYAARTYIGIPFINFVLGFDDYNKNKDKWTIWHTFICCFLWMNLFVIYIQHILDVLHIAGS